VNPIDAQLASSEAFHGITLAEPSWSQQTNYRSFFARVNEAFTVPTLPVSQQESVRAKAWRTALEAYYLDHPELEPEAFAIYSVNPRWRHNDGRRNRTVPTPIELETRRVVARRNIVRRLRDNFNLLEGLVEDFRQYAEPVLSLRRPVRRRTPTLRPVHPLDTALDRDRYLNTGHRRRISWSPAEDHILLHGLANRQSWLVISRQLELRTNTDCRDRWRTLMRRRRANQAAVAAEPGDNATVPGSESEGESQGESVRESGSESSSLLSDWLEPESESESEHSSRDSDSVEFSSSSLYSESTSVYSN
jgi:hypothetical protein